MLEEISAAQMVIGASSVALAVVFKRAYTKLEAAMTRKEVRELVDDKMVSMKNDIENIEGTIRTDIKVDIKVLREDIKELLRRGL